MAETTALRFEWVTDRTRFAQIQPAWDDLSHVALGTIFLSHAWLSTWLEEYATDVELHILTAWTAETLVGFLPLAGSVDGNGPRRWSFMGVGTLTPNHLDLVALPALREQVRDLFLGKLFETSDSWDVLEFNKLPADTPTADELAAAFAAHGMSTIRAHEADCPYCDLPATYEAYLASRSTRVRKKLRQTLRRFEEEGARAGFSQATTEAEAIEALDRLIELHQARWTDKGYPGAFAEPLVVRFHHSIVRRSFAEGSLRIYTLRDGDTIVGVSYDFHVDGTLQAYLSSFDPGWGRWSPGVLMRSFVIQHAIAEGVRRFDFLEGREQYKADWCTCERENVRLTGFNHTAAGQLARLRLSARDLAVSLARRFVPQSLRDRANKTLAARATSANE